MNGEHAEEFQQPTLKQSPKPQSINVEEEKHTKKRKLIFFPGCHTNYLITWDCLFQH